MKVRKPKDLTKVLKKKGFKLDPDKDHHKFFYLTVNGKKTNIYTFFSHGKKDYGNSLMTKVKKQLKFTDTQKAEDFFDCPMSGEEYCDMLREQGHLEDDT